MDFETFIRTQFSHGVEIETIKSIYNNQETISIYPSVTKLEVGKGYRIYSQSKFYDEMKKQIFEEVKKQKDEFESDVLYIESVIGTFSLSELFPIEHETAKKESLVYLQVKQDKIKNSINNH